jgi:uncharacterized integral membrane protein (TIGR00697 family)
MCIALSELMGGKTFPLLSFSSLKLSASVAIFVLPLVYGINDVVVEVYGKDRARSIVRSGLLTVLFLLLFSLLATNLPPTTRFASSEGAYDMIFGISARISAASLVAFTLAELADVFVFVKLRQKIGNKFLWLRTNVSNFVSQFLDTTVFITLAFYSLNKPFADNFPFLLGLILPYWLIKCFMSVIETPLVYLGVKWLKGEKKV